MKNKPRFERTCKGNVFGWEIYSWRSFFINIAFWNFEIQINKWNPGKETS